MCWAMRARVSWKSRSVRESMNLSGREGGGGAQRAGALCAYPPKIPLAHWRPTLACSDVGPVDAIVGRQRGRAELRIKVRQHLARFGGEGLLPHAPGNLVPNGDIGPKLVCGH